MYPGSLIWRLGRVARRFPSSVKLELVFETIKFGAVATHRRALKHLLSS